MDNIDRRQSLKIISVFGLVTILPLRALALFLNDACDECLQAWRSLGEFPRTLYTFRYIEPRGTLHNVFIYGDSISIGYKEYVRASFEGKANVYRLHENGGSSNDFIRKMEKLIKTMFQPQLKEGWSFEWDVIHFNVGLHDLKYVVQGKLDKEKGIQVSSLQVYEENLRSIIHYLKNTYPNAQLIFATTTPVPEDEPGRFVGDAFKYNKVALKVMHDFQEIVVNDLYTFSIPVLKTHAIGLGNVHYKAKGSRLQGIEVAAVIAETIGLTLNVCPSSENIKARSMEYEERP